MVKRFQHPRASTINIRTSAQQMKSFGAVDSLDPDPSGWEPTEMEVFQYRATCPKCVDGPWYTSDEEWKFCPVCGAHMNVEREVLGYNSLAMDEALRAGG